MEGHARFHGLPFFTAIKRTPKLQKILLLQFSFCLITSQFLFPDK